MNLLVIGATETMKWCNKNLLDCGFSNIVGGFQVAVTVTLAIAYSSAVMEDLLIVITVILVIVV